MKCEIQGHQMNISPKRILSAPSPVTLLTFSEDGSQLLSGCSDGTVLIWNTRSWKTLQTFQTNSVIQWVIELIPYSEYVLQTREGAFLIKKGLALTPLQSNITDMHQGFCKAHYLNTKLASPQKEADILIRSYNPKTGFECIRSLSLREVGSLTSLRWVREGKNIIANYEIGKMFLWNTETGQQLHSIDIMNSPWALDWDPHVSIGLVSGPHNEIICFTITDDYKSLRILKSRTLPTEGISEIKIRYQSKAKVACASSWDGTIRLFSWMQPEKIKSLGALKFHTETMNCVTTSCVPIKMEGKELYMIAAGSKDERISLWDIYNED
uniref:Guanine nucleotidebinding protein subunit betalike protein 1like [Bombus impatiens] n=1 Tax=Lepeophtheirus salmonis TaxID=72036 RepID=A0A0K2UB97_LEPSM